MSCCGDCVLLFYNEAANRTVFALCFAACGTGRGDGLVCNSSMSLGRNCRLLFCDGAANLAVLPVRETCLCAGGGNGFVGDGGVSLCGDDSLGRDNFSAVGAFFAVGEPIIGTSCSVALDGGQGVVGTQIGGANVADKVLVFVFVPQSRCGVLGAADFMGFAYLAVDNLIIAARSLTGGG